MTSLKIFNCHFSSRGLATPGKSPGKYRGSLPWKLKRAMLIQFSAIRLQIVSIFNTFCKRIADEFSMSVYSFLTLNEVVNRVSKGK